MCSITIFSRSMSLFLTNLTANLYGKVASSCTAGSIQVFLPRISISMFLHGVGTSREIIFSLWWLFLWSRFLNFLKIYSNLISAYSYWKNGSTIYHLMLAQSSLLAYLSPSEKLWSVITHISLEEIKYISRGNFSEWQNHENLGSIFGICPSYSNYCKVRPWIEVWNNLAETFHHTKFEGKKGWLR